LVHVEATPHIHRAMQLIHQNGVKAGVVANPGTPLSMITPILSLVDQVLIMTVNPGFGGQAFLPEMADKVAQLASMRDEADLNFAIEVDGGISDQTIQTVFDAGADIFVAGSYVYDAPDPAARIQTLKAIDHDAL